MKLFIKYISFIFLATFIASCAKEAPKMFSISGRISPATADYIILQKETDIERKITEVIDTLKVDAQGNFNASYNSAPYLYSLNFPNKNKISIALNQGQELLINITGYDTDDFKATAQGSKDTEELLAYENFRATSLERLVKSVRREITALKKDENPNQEKLDVIGLLEVTNYELHLKELNTYIKKNMDATLGLYATSIRWKGAKNLPLFDSLTTAYEAAHSNLKISKKLREKVTRLQQTAIGGKAANIEMKTVEGSNKIPSDKKNIAAKDANQTGYITVKMKRRTVITIVLIIICVGMCVGVYFVGKATTECKDDVTVLPDDVVTKDVSKVINGRYS